MSCGRSRALETGVGTPVAAGPAKVPFCEFGKPHKADWLAPELGNCAGELGDFQRGSDKLGMGHGHLGSERAVGGGQGQYRGTVSGSVCVDIGVSCAGSGDLSVTPFEVGCCEVHLEVSPGLVVRRLPLTGITVFKEEACLKKDTEGNSNHLLVVIGSIPCCFVLDESLELVE